MIENYTPDQEKAMKAKGNVLVSAAAGSGKTAVLVERVIRMLTDPVSPVSADRLLIATFTNAAAAEMRSRIENRLAELCAENPDDIALMKQRYLLGSAKICTIDSFCIDLVRENFSTVGIEPDFRIEDNETVVRFRESVMDEVLGEHLAARSPVFFDLLDIMGCEFDEGNLKKAVYDVFDYSRQLPFPDSFVESLSDHYERLFDKDHPWYCYAVNRLSQWLEESFATVQKALLLSENEENGQAVLTAVRFLSEENANLSECLQKNDWDGMVSCFENDTPKIGKSKTIAESFPLSTAKQLYEELVKERKKTAKLFLSTTEEVNRQLTRLKEPMRLFVRIVLDFSERLFQKQCEENVFTFYNTEQLALSMLCRNNGDEIELLPQAEELKSRFDEILVDEYQDTNDLQDMLFTILSDDGKHLFAVGDVKQSIYGFRRANPENFLRKRAACYPYEGTSPDLPKGITLAENFRSRREICDYVNYFFSNTMTRFSGKLIYDDSEKLKCGAVFPESKAPKVELHFYDGKLSEEKENRFLTEARGIAETVRRILAEGDCLKQDHETLRPATFGDIAVLMRSATDNAVILANELRRLGIPVSYGKESASETDEVTVFISLLKVLENPKDDVALLTVLLSPIFAFTPNDLALYRASYKNGDLYTVMTLAAKEDERAERFLERLSFMRRETVMLPLPKLISRLFALTDYPNTVAATENGKQRYERLMNLILSAEKYTKSAKNGLKGFLKFLESAGKQLPNSDKTGHENAVRLMTMHGSKGLQFPICILADLGGLFNQSDSRDNLLFSRENGFGIRYFEESVHEKVTTIGHEVLADAARKKLLEEELRLLYVAMTRAEERLVLVSYQADLQKRIDQLAPILAAEDSSVGGLSFRAANCFNDWILMTALLHPDGDVLARSTDVRLTRKIEPASFTVSVSYPKAAETVSENAVIFPESDDSLQDEIRQRLSFSYLYEPLSRMKAKTTVSELANRAESRKFDFSARPDFMEHQGLSAAARGTAMHKVMQFIRMEKNINLSEELHRLCDWRFIGEEECAAINRTALQTFLDSELYARILSALWFRREMRFLTEIPAGKLDASLPVPLSEEKIVVQGAVDLCFMEEDGLVILDFKTDRAENEAQLISAYAEQVSLYAAACEKIFGCSVKEKIIYSFTLGKTVQI